MYLDTRNKRYVDKEVGTRIQAIRLLRKKKLTSDEANEFGEVIGNMAFENIFTRSEAKMDVQATKIDANAELQKKKYSLLLWFIGVGVALIIASNFVGN